MAMSAMVRVFLWTIVALLIASRNVLQLSEAACENPRKNCTTHDDCIDREACIALKVGDQRKCYGCECSDKSQCVLQLRHSRTAKAVFCNCPEGIFDDQCECKQEEDCPQYSISCHPQWLLQP